MEFKKDLSITEQSYLLNQFKKFNKKHCLIVAGSRSIGSCYTSSSSFALIGFPSNKIQLS